MKKLYLRRIKYSNGLAQYALHNLTEHNQFENGFQIYNFSSSSSTFRINEFLELIRYRMKTDWKLWDEKCDYVHIVELEQIIDLRSENEKL